MTCHRKTAAARPAAMVAAALALIALAMPLQASDEVTNAEAGQTFREAFRPGMKLQERVNKLESVLLEYDPNKWTDDAVWALAEFAMRNGYLEQSARLHERLLRGKQLPCLQAFTRTTPLYHTSRVKFEQWILEQTGHRYARGRKPLAAIPYNPLPMSLSGQLGYIYERLGRRRRALHCYTTALSLCPRRTLLERIYRQRLAALEEKLRKESPAQSEGKKGSHPPVPEWQRVLRKWDRKQAEKRSKKGKKKESKKAKKKAKKKVKKNGKKGTKKKPKKA